MSAYLSESESGESDVRVRVISRMALFTSMMDDAVSNKNMSTMVTNIHIDARERRFGLLYKLRESLCAVLVWWRQTVG